ncbi:hypothetical protein P4361_16265 [Fictibacillus sp. B-59209]|uniref:hypothetical protein n=1 Tax=Fictibacillus sp. B-59209 TaxID=3024873 RepID=UPI002E20F31B|nr:hypothetical protein [Fictibacillus sp. B-59209]
MSKPKIIILWTVAVFFLYFAWSDFVQGQFKFSKFEGRVLEKDYSEKAVERGTNIQSLPNYTIRLSSGQAVSVSLLDFNSIKKGDHVFFIKQNGSISLYKRESQS